MLGEHCIKTWSASQGAVALSSAEAEFYGMIEGVTRAKGLLSLARELGFEDLSTVVHLGTDSSAAKSFVRRRGLGRMRHLEIRDLWLQKEVREGKVVVNKILGTENPADLMTKILSLGDIEDRLKGMNLYMRKPKEVHHVYGEPTTYICCVTCSPKDLAEDSSMRRSTTGSDARDKESAPNAQRRSKSIRTTGDNWGPSIRTWRDPRSGTGGKSSQR